MSGAPTAPDGARAAPSPPPLDGPRLAVLAVAGLGLLTYHAFYDSHQLWPRLPGTVGLVVGGDVLPLAIAPLLVLRLLGEPRARAGWRLPRPRALLTAAGLAYLAVLPVALWLATRPDTCAAYPSPAFPPARAHALGLAFLWVLHHAPQLFSVEAFFRGSLFLPLARRLGLVPTVIGLGTLYVALHVQPTKPPQEIVLAAWGGLVFMAVAWRWQSFLPCFLAHLAIAVTIDLLCFAAIPAAGSP